jgi:Pyruvate/2-oxoacid:ferredoxin oxidoreductase gamma subunit
VPLEEMLKRIGLLGLRRNAYTLRAGADGYLTKDRAPEDLIAAVRKVAEGGRYVTPSLAERLAAYARVCRVPATRIASEMGNTRAANVVLLGAMSNHVPGFSVEQWRAAISACVPPKHRGLNLAAFDKGREAKTE